MSGILSDPVIRQRFRKRVGESSRAAEAARARTDFAAFFEFVGQARGGESFVVTPGVLLLADVMLECLAAGKHVNIVAPPGLYKSTVARHVLAFLLGRNPLLRTVAVSAEISLAKRVTASVRSVVGHSRFRAVFPDVKLDTSKERKLLKEQSEEDRPAMGNEIGKFYFLNSGGDPDPAMEAVASEPEGQMRRVDIGLFDDMETQRTALSVTMRESTRRAFLQTWLGGRLKNPVKPGVAFCIHNLWHSEDLPSTLAKDPRFCSVWIGVSMDLQSLFVRVHNAPHNLTLTTNPAKYGAARVGNDYTLPLPGTGDYTPERLAAEKQNNPYFDCQYHLIPLSDKDRMFPSWSKRPSVATLGEYFKETTRDGRGMVVFPPHVSDRYAFAAGLDFSGRKRPGDVIAIPCVDANRIIRLAEIHYGNFTTRERFRILDDAWKRGLRFQTVRVEGNAVQDQFEEELRVLAREMRAGWAHLIEAHQTTGNKADPQFGLPPIEQEIAMGNFHWCEELTAPTAPMRDAFRRFDGEMQTCPLLTTAEMTPDGCMAFWFGYKGLKERGLVRTAAQMPAMTVVKGASKWRDM